MPKMYDFGTDTSNVSANERRALAWPTAVWSCYIPESEAQNLNILEHLLLRLVQNGIKEPKQALCEQIGFNKELVDAAIERCRDEDYFDGRHRELVLSENGKAVLDKIENPYEADLETSQKCKKIYMIQDLVTKSVVPVFDIEKLPEFYVEDESAIEVHYKDFSGKKPKSASIKTALRYWAKLCYNRRHGIESGTNTVDVSQKPSAEFFGEGFAREQEVDWEQIKEDGSLRENGDEEIRTLADKEEEDKQNKSMKDVLKITILDDSPDIYYAIGYLAINRNAPDEAIVVSPFGARFDDWFRTVINRLRICDEAFEDEIQSFLRTKRDELKDSIAFGNELDIALFDDFPFICNDSEYRAVKETIKRLTKSKNRIQKGEDDTINFAQALRTAYEASIRLIVKKNPYLFEARKLGYEEYRQNLEMLVNSYSFLEDDVFREYSSRNMHRNMTRTTGDDGYATAFFALFLMDAWKNRNGKSMDLLRNLPDLPIRLKALTSRLRREGKYNKTGEGTAASHGGDAIAELNFTEEKVLERYGEFERLFKAFYSRFMEVG